ncbi:MAG: hypothetical protein K0Q79_71 [Flavipsychrobacter sp.]|jgi:hypothetical protein|nr:hypothetical protein [Flavipsychrobacter sp.]
MSVNKKIVTYAAAALVLGTVSCKKFMDVNNNPNIAKEATVQTLLPAAQLHVASALGVELQINGSVWGQFWTQSPNASQYKSLEQYSPGQDHFSTAWSNLYAAGENFYQLYNLADSQNKKPYMAIAMIMKAYTFQLITDAWGNVPYTQALKGQFADSNILNPKYDLQSVVYKGILANIDSGLKLIATSGSAPHPGNDDLIYHGDMSKWVKFAYTLKLRMYLRMSAKDPLGAQAGITALYSDPNFQLIGMGDDAFISFGATTTNKSPLYAEASSATLGGTQNLVGSATCIDSMNSNGDPRAYVFYNGTAASGGASVVGIRQGDYNTSVSTTIYSIPSHYVAGDAADEASGNAPVLFLTSWESFFLQAEVVARGYVGASFGITDDSLFKRGIQASFDYYASALNSTYVATFNDPTTTPYPITGSVYMDYMTGAFITGSAVGATPGYWVVYPTSGTIAQKVRHIITQKWFAMCGNQGFEAWTEQRRTGYPDFFVISKNTLVGSNFPVRFLYPTSESTRNINFPGLAPITSKMWWDL